MHRVQSTTHSPSSAKSAEAPARTVGHLSACGLALLAALVSPSLAQSCDSATGTSEGIGMGCVEDPTAVGFSSFANLFAATVISPLSGKTVAAGSAQANAFLRPELRAALALVAGRSGAVLATGGEFRQKSGLFQVLGFDDAHALTISIAYRSHEVDSWRISGDGVATADDPFGPGWRASWGDLIVAPNQEGEPITRIDEHGVRWTHTQVSQTSDVVGPLDEPVINRIYDGQAGSRLVLEHYYLNGQVTPVWFREWPDRTRHQYAGQPNTGSDQVLARIYRGDFFAPDWQVVFAYDGQGRLGTITDARGFVYTLTWTAFGATRRVTGMAVSGPWSHNWAALDIVFEYEASSPYRLQRVRKPARAFVDDQDRSGSYEPQESFTGELITRYTYVGASNLIERVYDESTGLSRLQLEVVYDTSVPWRATVLRVGETSSLPGQGQRVHGFAYPQAGRMVWTDPRGVARQYDFDTSFGSSPRQWRVTRIEEFAGANDPRPTNDPHYYGSLVWSYAWNCGCGELREVTLPSGIKHTITYDPEGRGLITATGIVPVGQSTPQQVRTWTYRSWNDLDYRLASRLSGYTDALGKTGMHSFAFDATYGGYRVTGTFAGTELFTLQEDSKGRMVWREEGTFQVDGGGTSRNRMGFQFGTSTSQADYLLVNRIDTYQGTSVVAWRTFGYAGMGWLASLTDEKGRTTTLVNDDVGLLRQGILPTTSSGRASATYGATFQFEYDRFGQVAIAKQTAHDDQGTAYARAQLERVRVFDYFGRPWKDLTDVARLDQASPQWLTTTHEYDLDNRLVRVRASGGRETVYLIDDHGRLYQRRSKLDGSTWSVEQHGYYPDGVLARVVEPTGLEGTVDGLDAWGRPQWIHLPGQKHVFFVRDDEDRVTSREYRIGAVGSTVLKQTAAWALDDLGRILTESISAPGLSTPRTATLTYNGPFRVATVIDGDGRGWTLGYDYLGRTVRRQDRLLGTSGNAEVFVRDILGVVTRVDHVEQRQTGPSTHSPVTYRTDLVYDAWDRLIRAEFWGKAATLQSTRHRAHDSLGNLTWTKDGVGKEVARAFDAAGRMIDEWIHQRNAALQPVHLGMVYDDQPADPLLSAILTRTDGLGNASEYRYDLLGRMVERRLPGYVAGSGAKRWTYEYDLARQADGLARRQRDAGAAGLRRRKAPPAPRSAAAADQRRAALAARDRGDLDVRRLRPRRRGADLVEHLPAARERRPAEPGRGGRRLRWHRPADARALPLPGRRQPGLRAARDQGSRLRFLEAGRRRGRGVHAVDGDQRRVPARLRSGRRRQARRHDDERARDRGTAARRLALRGRPPDPDELPAGHRGGPRAGGRLPLRRPAPHDADRQQPGRGRQHTGLRPRDGARRRGQRAPAPLCQGEQQGGRLVPAGRLGPSAGGQARRHGLHGDLPVCDRLRRQDHLRAGCGPQPEDGGRGG